MSREWILPLSNVEFGLKGSILTDDFFVFKL
jgi:hypothetical protein